MKAARLAKTASGSRQDSFSVQGIYPNMSCSLNLKGGYIADYIGDFL